MKKKRNLTFLLVVALLSCTIFSSSTVLAATDSGVQPRSATYLAKGGIFSGQQTLTFNVPSNTNCKVLLSASSISGNDQIGLTVSSSQAMVLNKSQAANGKASIYYNVPLDGTYSYYWHLLNGIRNFTKSIAKQKKYDIT
jgi:hypothetical protein